MRRQSVLWALAALLGIVLTAGITRATSQLTSQHIGISSEPISAGRRLAPPVAAQPAGTRPDATRGTITPTSTQTVTITVPPSSAPSPTTSAPPVSAAPPTSSEPTPSSSPPVQSAPAAPAVTAPPTQPSRSSRSSRDDSGGGGRHGGGRDD
ncbi:MAG: hypothetical protein WAN93_09340 [Solirubrobacteraceae bacterium]